MKNDSSTYNRVLFGCQTEAVIAFFFLELYATNT